MNTESITVKGALTRGRLISIPITISYPWDLITVNQCYISFRSGLIQTIELRYELFITVFSSCWEVRNEDPGNPGFGEFECTGKSCHMTHKP